MESVTKVQSSLECAPIVKTSNALTHVKRLLMNTHGNGGWDVSLIEYLVANNALNATFFYIF